MSLLNPSGLSDVAKERESFRAGHSVSDFGFWNQCPNPQVELSCEEDMFDDHGGIRSRTDVCKTCGRSIIVTDFISSVEEIFAS